MKKGEIIAVISIIIAVVSSTIGYAMNWQRDQDGHLSKLNSMVKQQTIILEKQIELNELKYQRITPHSDTPPKHYTYPPSPPVRKF